MRAFLIFSLSLVIMFTRLITGAPPIKAQEDKCSTIVQNALESTSKSCIMGNDLACLGYPSVTAYPLEEGTDFTFAEPGDKVHLASLHRLVLEGMDLENGSWGLVRMRSEQQIGRTDLDLTAVITSVLFGNVEIETAEEKIPTLELTANGDLNIRTGPSIDYAIAGGVTTGQTLKANGRNTTSDWLHIETLNTTGIRLSGWVFAPLVTAKGDISNLSLIEDADAQDGLDNNWKSFYFRSGIDDALCDEAPNSGALIQTDSRIEFELEVNETRLTLASSTIYLQAQPAGEMIINVLEGRVWVEALDTEIVVPAGARVRLQLDAQNAVSSPPSGLEPYDQFGPLPTRILGKSFVIPEPMDESQLQEMTRIGSIAPTSGIWRWTWEYLRPPGGCPCSVSGDISYEVEINTLNNGAFFATRNVGGDIWRLYTAIEPGIYLLSGSPMRIEFTFPNHAQGALTCQITGSTVCTVEFPFELEFVREGVK